MGETQRERERRRQSNIIVKMRLTMGDIQGMGIAAPGAQAEDGRFMGVAAQSDHCIGGSDILRIR